MKRPTRNTGLTVRVNHIANIVTHCVIHIVSPNLLRSGAHFLCGNLVLLTFCLVRLAEGTAAELIHLFGFFFCCLDIFF